MHDNIYAAYNSETKKKTIPENDISLACKILEGKPKRNRLININT